MIKRPQTLAASIVAVALSLFFSGPLTAQLTRFECGIERLLADDGCVLSLFTIGVVIASSGMSSINTVNIRLMDTDASASEEVDGIVYRAEIADLNSDGRPEVLAYVSSAGSGSYGP